MPADLTDARRQRSLELWGMTPRKAAEKLLDEGFGGAVSRVKAKYILQMDTMRRQFERDRDWWREKWRKERERARKAETAKDPVEREAYIASLETVQGELEDVLDDRKLKGTPRVQALSELRQIKQAIGKAQGVDAIGKQDDEGGEAPQKPTVLVLDLSNCSTEVKERVTHGRGGGTGTG